MKYLLMGLIRLYQAIVSPVMGPQCRFIPTCSRYALDALSHHGACKGSYLTVRRLLRCHPFSGKSGFDPVPPSHSCSHRDSYESSI